MAKPDSKDADASESPAPVSKTPWVFSGPEQIAAAKDLERDPLSELLGANEMAQQAAPDSSSSNIDDDDSYDVPLSILTRRRQLAQMRGLEQPNEEKEKEAALNKPVSSVPPAKPDKPGLSDRERSPDKPAQKTEETPKTQDAQKSSGSYAVYNPLENPDDDSPFSGGPPPKKRQ